MKNIYFLLACTLGMLFPGCSSDDDMPEVVPDENSVEVSIQTEIQTRATVTTAFKQGDVMNLYAKAYGRLDAEDLVKDVRADYDGDSWKITPSIRVSKGGKAFIYAVYPFVEGLTDLTKVPVDISKQQDVLYSGSFVPVSFTSHTAKLTMKHALALVTFNIGKQGYEGNGALQQMSLSGDRVFANGTMNVQSGKITGVDKKTVDIAVQKNIQDGGWKEDLPRIWTIPFSTKGDKALLKVKIDGKMMEARMPEIEMKGGYQYIFRLILTNHGLEFIADQIEVISLNQDTDAMKQLNGYGLLKVTHVQNKFMAPTLWGDQVFGHIVWGDGNSESYAFGAEHDFASSESKVTMIESWNSTGFQLKNIQGVEVIDISEYE